jgi:hypothetical protein
LAHILIEFIRSCLWEVLFNIELCPTKKDSVDLLMLVKSCWCYNLFIVSGIIFSRLSLEERILIDWSWEILSDLKRHLKGVGLFVRLPEILLSKVLLSRQTTSSRWDLMSLLFLPLAWRAHLNLSLITVNHTFILLFLFPVLRDLDHLCSKWVYCSWRFKLRAVHNSVISCECLLSI